MCELTARTRAVESYRMGQAQVQISREFDFFFFCGGGGVASFQGGPVS